MQRFIAPAELTGAVIEFGTRSRDDMRQALQADRQLKFGGVLTDTQRSSLREQVLEAFSPSSPRWQQRVLGHAMALQHQMLQGCMDWR